MGLFSGGGGFDRAVRRGYTAFRTGGFSELARGNKQPSGPGDYTGPKFGIAKTQDFIKDTPTAQLPGSEALTRRFQGLRDEAGQGANVAKQQASDAIKRKFSALGGGGSGAQIKLEQLAFDQAEQQKRQSLKDIGQQELEAFTNRDLAQADMDFKQKAFNFESGSKMHELNLAERQQQIGQAESEYNSRLNQFLNKPPKQGIISNILGTIL